MIHLNPIKQGIGENIEENAHSIVWGSLLSILHNLCLGKVMMYMNPIKQGIRENIEENAQYFIGFFVKHLPQSLFKNLLYHYDDHIIGMQHMEENAQFALGNMNA